MSQFIVHSIPGSPGGRARLATRAEHRNLSALGRVRPEERFAAHSFPEEGASHVAVLHP
jgi:hypothetical protein